MKSTSKGPNEVSKPMLFGLFFLMALVLSAAKTEFIDNVRTVDQIRGTIVLAASCFAALGLVAVMPWQLAQTIAPEDGVSRSNLIRSGATISLGSLGFLFATVVRYGAVIVSRSSSATGNSYSIEHGTVIWFVFWLANLSIMMGVLLAIFGLFVFVRELWKIA